MTENTEKAAPAKSKVKKKRLAVLLVYAVIALIIIGIGWSAMATTLVRGFDAKQERDPETGILIGAEPRDLGPKDAEGAVLFVHGFNGCPNNYNDFPDKVAAAGWRAKAMLLPGHGTSPIEFEKQSPDDLVNAVLAEIDALRGEHEKVVLVGHSMGGAIATIVASKRDLDGLILCGPYYGLKQSWFYPVQPERFIRAVSPVLRWVRGIEGMQPITDKTHEADIISYTWVSVQSGLTAIELGERARQPHLLARIDEPVLLLNGLKDSLTSYETSIEHIAYMKSKIKKEHVLPEADHVLFWDFGNEEACAAVLDFLDNLDS